MSTRPHKSERGMALVMLALVSAVLLGFVGLAVDSGYLEWTRVRAQTAADAAAMAGVQQLKSGGDKAGAITAALNAAKLNGFADDADGVDVQVNVPPTAGPLAGNSSAVEAIVSRNSRTFFMSVLGTETAGVTARAVGSLGGSGGGCIYALNPTASRSLNLAGSQSTHFMCGATVASSAADAFHMEGSGKLWVKPPANVGVFGGYSLTGQTSVVEYPSGVTRNPVKIDRPSDPLAHVEPPSMAGLQVQSWSKRDCDMNRPCNPLKAGIYCGGLRVGNTGSTTFQMEPGVYVMAGGGFEFQSVGRMKGTGVTIYLTSGPASGVPGCNAPFTGFTIDGQFSLQLDAPTSGPLEGIAVFQDRSIASTAESKVVGGSSININGAIYMPRQPLLFSGNDSTSGYLILVADTIRINGNSRVNADYSSLQSGSPIKSRASLAE